MKVDNSMVSAMYAGASSTFKAEKSQSKAESNIDKTSEKASEKVNKKSGNYGKTIGDAQLSEAGAKYYEELKKKYSNMDFILVSNDQVEGVEAKAASYANPAKTVVLIDVDKVEKMASDESYRKQYEGIISGAEKNLDQLKSQISGIGADVKGYGIRVNDDGTSSFFAVLKKSSAAQKERIAKKAAEKKEQAKKAEKKAKEEKAQERLDKGKERSSGIDEEASDSVTISADSINELTKKVSDFVQNQKTDLILTSDELMLGQSIDFRG